MERIYKFLTTTRLESSSARPYLSTLIFVGQWPNNVLTCSMAVPIEWWKRRGTGQKRGTRILDGCISVDDLAAPPASLVRESGYPEAQP